MVSSRLPSLRATASSSQDLRTEPSRSGTWPQVRTQTGQSGAWIPTQLMAKLMQECAGRGWGDVSGPW